MYVCGTYLVMLAAPPGVSGSSATRSLFGGTSGLSSLKSKIDTGDAERYNWGFIWQEGRIPQPIQ